MIPKTGNKQADTVLIIVLVAFILFIVYKVTQLIKKGTEFIQDPFGTDEENSQLQAQIQVDESKLTYHKYQYSTWADAIETAILSDLDEDEEAVDSIIWQIQNDNDWAQLIKDFGVRQDVYFGAIPGQNYNLVSAISHFLPERVTDYNNHFAGWNMTSRI
jgi:hypothetical protein